MTYFDLQGVSDHNPVLVQKISQVHKRRIPFRYKDVWSEDDQFNKIVEEVWSMDMYGIEMFKLVKKLGIESIEYGIL